jgi:hypothetical protein
MIDSFVGTNQNSTTHRIVHVFLANGTRTNHRETRLHKEDHGTGKNKQPIDNVVHLGEIGGDKVRTVVQRQVVRFVFDPVGNALDE